MSRNNINPMGWHTNPLMLLHNRQFAYGGRYALPIPKGYLLPFQLLRSNGGGDITRFEIINESGVTFDVLASATLMLDYKNGPSDESYDVVRFRGAIPFVGSWELGWYRSIISDGATTWESDWFLWTNDDLVKIEWCHINHIEIEGGRIDYSDGFKFWVYLKTDIGMPQYPFEEEVTTNAGESFPFRQTSSKQYQFPAIVSEYLMDCMRLVAIHSEVKIHHLDDVLRATRIRHGRVKWIERGDIAEVLWTFLTKTTTSTYAQSIGALSIPGGERCLDVAFVANTFINDVNGALNFPYEGAGQFLSEPLSYALYSNTGEDGAVLYFNPGNGQTPYPAYTNQGDIIFVRDTQKYYLVSDLNGGSIVAPRILSVGSSPTYTITGIVLPGSTIHIQYRSEGSGWNTAHTVLDPAFNGGVDLGPSAADWTQVRLVFLSPLCGEILTTPVYSIDNGPTSPVPTGIAYDEIGTTLEVY